MSPTGPLYAGAISAGADWTDFTGTLPASGASYAVGPPDGITALNGNQGPGGGGGHTPSQLITSSHGFALPTGAIIEGIKLEAFVYGDTGSGDLGIFVGTNTKSSLVTPNRGQIWPNPLGMLTWGNSTSLWGRTDWTAADINSSSFGASLSALASHGTGNIEIDAVRITVYWHNAPTAIPQQKLYLYKVFDSLTGVYLGNLPKVTSDFLVSQDINTAGAQITIACGISADTSALPVDVLTDEAGNILTDEGSSTLTNEGQQPQTGIGTSSALIRDGNRVEVWEYGYFHINGICMFKGVIERHTDNFGGDTGDENVTMLVYSDGQDLDNYLVRGNPYTYTQDQAQGASNQFESVSQNIYGQFQYYGQTWKVGVGFTNLDAINLAFGAGNANVTISIYTNTATNVLLGSITQNVNIGIETVITFAFPNPIPVVPGTTYFFTVSVDSGQTIPLVYQNTDVYANGSMYSAFYGGGAGGGNWSAATGDLYFATFSGTGSTVAAFTTTDPSTGMLQTIMNDYNARGGLIVPANIEATGLALSYGFNTNTVYEGVQGALTISPSGFYYYVDLGKDALYYQRANTIADYVLTKGIHINKLSVVSTTEYVVNAVYTVGAMVAGSNVYSLDFDADSIRRYGLRMQVHTDNNIPDLATAHAVGASIVDAGKDEQYQTQVTIVDTTMDTTLLVPGKIIGFNGFGTYVDNLLAQIVHRDYSSGSVTLTLGILPKRTTVAVEQVTRGLVALSTITNPTSPS